MDQSLVGLNASEEIKPYKVHVSSKYLELTKKKLELTRLPHEVLLPKSREWELGTPKSAVEPLIDYWLETYSWRAREEELNTTLPQFRTAIALPPPLSPTLETVLSPPLRLHFIHIRAPHPNSIPLLLLPPFPLTNLTLSTTTLFSQLSNPSSPTSTQSFHVICPSIPGLGFSDAFSTTPSTSTSEISHLEQTAYLFNTLMLRLGYEHYLCSSTGSGTSSPAGVDYHLTHLIGTQYPDNCLGIHVLEPCIQPPTLKKEPASWMKYQFAKFFHASIFGYQTSDWTSLHTSSSLTPPSPVQPQSQTQNAERQPLLPASNSIIRSAPTCLGITTPQTLSYALCDSPVGLLSFICSALHALNPEHNLSDETVIDITQMAWLPGPEAGLRLYSSVASTPQPIALPRRRGKCRTAITVSNTPPSGTIYSPPAWSAGEHDIIFTQRVPGSAGLLIWERGDVLLDGIRGLAKIIDALDSRLRVRELESVVVEPVRELGAGSSGVVREERERRGSDLEGEQDGNEESGIQMDVESPDTVVAVDLSRDV